MANNKPPAIPGRAAGIITFFIASERVDPTASAPSLSEVGTAVILVGLLLGAFEGLFVGALDGEFVGLLLGTSVGAFDVSLGVYHDIDTENTYVELGAGTSFDLTDNISLDLGATIGNNQDEVVGGQADGLTAVTITVGAPIGLTDNASLTPYLGINAGLDDNQDAGDEIFSGISLSVGF